MVVVRGCSFSYDMRGAGRPVVLLHGLGGTKAIWTRVADLLEPHVTTVIPDLRGAGATQEPDGAEAPLTVDAWAHDVRALVDDLAIDTPRVLVGHSLGASIALRYAIWWPEDVSALVLIGADPNLARLGPRMRRSIETIERVGFGTWVDEHWSGNTPFSARSLERTPEVLQEYREMLLSNRERDYLRFCEAIATADDLSGELGAVAAPVLVVSGAADDRTLPDAGRELAARLPDAEYLELADVGHTAPLEAPVEVAEAILDFVERKEG